MAENPEIQWSENGVPCTALWHSESGHAPPKRVVVADDRMTADAAYRLASQGTSILWRGDFQNARQMLHALARRIDRKSPKPGDSARDSFHLLRQAQAQRARILGALLLPFETDYAIPLRRAPDVRLACSEVLGPSTGPSVLSLRELLGLIGAHEWRKKGIELAPVGERIYPHYGVFAPVRSEYLDLVAKAPLPPVSLAFDIGTGTGVLSVLLAKRGVARIVATDQEPRALTCARENIARLGLEHTITVQEADLFPVGRADLIVCNPPWIPSRPSSPLEQAIFDPHSRMLLGYLGGLKEHLEEGGEGWLILSDIAEHLGLRTRAELLDAFAAAKLKVIAQSEVVPVHRKAHDPDDPLSFARRAERTSLWRLAVDDRPA